MKTNAMILLHMLLKRHKPVVTLCSTQSVDHALDKAWESRVWLCAGSSLLVYGTCQRKPMPRTCYTSQRISLPWTESANRVGNWASSPDGSVRCVKVDFSSRQQFLLRFRAIVSLADPPGEPTSMMLFHCPSRGGSSACCLQYPYLDHPQVAILPSDRANRFETEYLNYKLIKTGGFVVYSLAENRNLTDPVKFRLSPRHSSLTTKNNFIKRIVD